MTTPTETFQKASFNELEFPILRVSVKGGLRHFLHEFPHSPGAEVEKMGRKAYSISMMAFFHDLPGTRLSDDYADLYPNRLQLLQGYFENETTGNLIVPGLGTIRACAIDWRRTLDYQQSLSGETFELEFVEDQERSAVFEDLVTKAAGLEPKSQQLGKLLVDAKPPKSILDKIQDVINDINAAVDQVLAVEGLADAYAQLLEAKVLQVINLCQMADRMTELQSPAIYSLVQGIHDVQLTAMDVADDILQRRAPIATWLVPNLMSAAQASVAIFGSADKAVDLIQMNPIEDAFAIPAGTVLRYYRAA